MMALRNMFDMVATEGTLRQLLRQLSFAKTPGDAMRVNIENPSALSTVSTQYNASSTTTVAGGALAPQLWGATSWNTVDGRYAFGEQQVLNFIQNRERWTFS